MVRKALAEFDTFAGLAVGTRESDFAGKTRVEPEVDKVGAKGGCKQRADDSGCHAVLVRGRDRVCCYDSPDWQGD